MRGRGEAEKIELAVFGTFYVPSRSLRSLRLSVSKRISKPVNAEAQRNAEGARSGRKIGEDEDGMGGVQEGIFCWIALELKSLRSLRLSVSKKISEPVNAEAQRNAEGARSGVADWGFVLDCYRAKISALSASQRFKEDPGDR